MEFRDPTEVISFVEGILANSMGSLHLASTVQTASQESTTILLVTWTLLLKCQYMKMEPSISDIVNLGRPPADEHCGRKTVPY